MGGLQDGIQPQLAFGFRQMTERIDRAGDGHSVRCIQRNRSQAVNPQFLRIGCGRGAARAVQGANLILSGPVVEDKTIAPNPVI